MHKTALTFSLCLLPLLVGCGSGDGSGGSADSPKKEAWQKREQVYTDKTPDEWLKLIQNRNFQVRNKAIDALVQYAREGKDTLPALIEIVANKSAGAVRLSVAQALGAMGPKAKSAVPALAKALADTAWDGRDGAATALGDIHENPDVGVPALIKALADPDARVRGAAARGIGRYRSSDPEAIAALAKTLEDEDDTVKAQAAEALQGIGPKAKAAIPALEKAAKAPGFITAQAAEEALKSVRGN